MSSENVIVSNSKRSFNGIIQLTGSKSESNRALILQALSNGNIRIENLSSAADTVTLHRILQSEIHNPGATVDIGPAGTAMRFLTAYSAVKGLDVTLTGTARMKQRPIGMLVDALRVLGADISYTENEGFPPIKTGSNFVQKANRVSIKGNVSSQYITALLLVAPTLPQGLDIYIEGELTSKPYVEMTLTMLEQSGIAHTWTGNTIHIDPQAFKPVTLTVEPDWSAASYWYSIAALSQEAVIELPYLKADSLQGDSRIADIMAHFGIVSTFTGKGLTIRKTDKELTQREFDFKECPDLAQTVVVCCAALGHNATFTGLETLKIKETDRVKALQNELAKIGVTLTEDNETYYLDCSQKHIPEKVSIHTYDDHRMAMAFAPLALVIDEVEIEDHQVVEKSYPHYWDDLKKAGFNVQVQTSDVRC
ncbi:3-phosphoshikimate 1-carboxyvinyltransferase [Pedobacter sp. BS3]|uniref:3-phosphoshikimate 1-carboxyvinyltransferase n=1 Tax=Pedobacter sp. BS3 TaxID=2567937 RepID=UPI0011EDEBD4|nr:3-phosphoshikimate 1-carboxyvinyltransferase [Pedobacter sp. BS3]TZF83813.1 3-phosphoshikimate 1-carboxyvinyltransferase [Pedobacter sp. BS3]